MHACRLAMASVLLGMAVTMSFTVTGASLQVGITIVKGCDARTTDYFDQNAGAAVRADCSANTPYNVSVAERPMQDGRSPPPLIPHGTYLMSVEQRYRIATMTF